jgi:hypothetical protein
MCAVSCNLTQQTEDENKEQASCEGMTVNEQDNSHGERGGNITDSFMLPFPYYMICTLNLAHSLIMFSYLPLQSTNTNSVSALYVYNTDRSNY